MTTVKPQRVAAAAAPESPAPSATFDGRDVIQISVKIVNAGDGLSQSLTVAPHEIYIGDTGVVALEYVCTKVQFVEIKDTECLNRVATLRAGAATMIDREVVAKALDAQAFALERMRGVQRLPMDDNPDGDA